MPAMKGHVLVVDDSRVNRARISHVLRQQGHTVTMAENGQEAVNLIDIKSFDLMLLDIVMPEMDGYQVLERMNQTGVLRDVPVIVISALEETDSVVRCIEMGAEDYLTKPFDPVLLKARVGASLEKKRLRDQEQAVLKQLQEEQEKSEGLLLNILPKPIADRLKQGEVIIADSFTDVTILIADIVNFTKLSSDMSPKSLVFLLNGLFSLFDELAEKYGLEKIKTSGDSYMVVGGLPTARPDHAQAVANMALDMQEEMALYETEGERPLCIRIGIHTGQVVAGVIGTKKFSYDLWGDSVNTADRMQSTGIGGQIQVSQSTYERLDDGYKFEERGIIQVKGKGEMQTYLLIGRS